MSRTMVAIGLCALGAAQVHDTAAAESQYPVRPIRVLVPFAPGGATDIIARVLEPSLTRKLGQQIVIDNRTGAAGNIAVELVAQSQPDGYTLLVGNISTNSINPILFAKRMKIDALKDLTGITKLVAIPELHPRQSENAGADAQRRARIREAAAGAAQLPGAAGFVFAPGHARAHRRCGGSDGAPAFQRRG
jgi:hypothetical protein